MGLSETEKDEPLTPAGRLFLRKETEQIINCAIGFKSPNSDVSAFKSAISGSLLVKNPRFTSLLVIDRHGREYWRKTDIDIDKHILVIDSVPADGEDALNDYLADLSISCPLSTDKPLWEIHLLLEHNCAVLRLHHALGDGISLMSLFLASCRKADDPDALPVTISSNSINPRERRTCLELLKILWITLVYVLGFIGRVLWVKDEKTAVTGGAGVELWPRKLATARFFIEDMKMIKKAIPNITINDVLFGVISLGLSKYLDLHSPKALPEGLQLTGLAMVNLRKIPGLQEVSDSKAKWGNKFGAMLLPVYYHKAGADPLNYLKRSKAMLDRKKQSLEAPFSYFIGDFVMSCFGPKVASWLNYRIMCNTTFTISNVIGPTEEIAFEGNLVTSLRVNSSGLPHAITMHMVSYAGRAEMQISVPKDLIHEPKVLAKCFEDALLELKEAAAAIG